MTHICSLGPWYSPIPCICHKKKRINMIVEVTYFKNGRELTERFDLSSEVRYWKSNGLINIIKDIWVNSK